IIKNRWFIFGSIQDTRQSNSGSSSRQVPTAAERAGNFAATYFPCGNSSCTVATTVTSAQLGFVATTIMHNPFLPASGMSTTTNNLVTQYVPLPNAPNGSPFYLANIPTKNNNYEYVIKSDYDLGNNRIFGRFFRQHNLQDIHTLTAQDMNTAVG